MGFDRKYLVWALGYAVVGMALGVFMAASHDHGQNSTHVHILLVGFVLSFVYACIHRLWFGAAAPGAGAHAPRAAAVQFYIHQAGALIMIAGLFLLFGGRVPPQRIEPVLAIGSIAVLLGALLMFYMVLAARAAKAASSPR